MSAPGVARQFGPAKRIACGAKLRFVLNGCEGLRPQAGSPPTARRRAPSGRERRHAAAERAWKASDQPEWLTAQVYREQVQPRLATVSAARMAAALAISISYAVDIRAGRRRPHPRHWRAFAELADMSP